MGCASSKQKRCRRCNGPYSPAPRSYSMHVHHPPQTEGDSYHVVALTSTTLGTLKLNSPASNCHLSQNIAGNFGQDFKLSNGKVSDTEKKTEEFSMGLIEAKTWSNMIEQKLPKVFPKTPTRTPPGEPETINTWELMEGLEDITPFRSPCHFRSFSFDVNGDDADVDVDVDPPKLRFSSEEEKTRGDDDVEVDPCGKDKVVLYFTSLRGVRKTYEDCCQVRLILKGLGVRVDERDVSMHSGFKEELRELLDDGYGGGGLPRVFVGRNYIGGAEEIQKLHEDGKLEKLLGGCEKIEDSGGGDGGRVCEACGDVRFVPCETCSGSCKIYYDGDEDEEFVDAEVGECGFQRCPDCNENGLIRCPLCCY
ncbi:uncharacterized protein At5g39865-like isoform X2 [Abrus precatorius]|uniref:Uncharacterized protein At5g39865-like isoform X2 n=1 Tax=Abrus precatorius TaxID=3816 RepID=A0A8B8L918_ABRPR|nr:uncharacterized protein At5g39865-like isoform X2 [Abrus precatorius]